MQDLNLQGPTRLVDTFQTLADQLKMKQCVLILMVQLHFLEKLLFFNNFGKSFVLILYYQLPFLQNGRFLGKMNWTVAQLDLASLSSAHEV